MNIPSAVMKQVKKSPTDNMYFYHAFDSLEGLQEVYDGKVKFRYDHSSQLVNALERLYKGAILSKTESDPNIKIQPGYLTQGHNIASLVDTIEMTIGWQLTPIESRRDYKERYTFLKDLQKLYTDARYNTFPTYEEFKKIFDFVELQKETILEYLNPKVKTLEEEEMEDDFLRD